METPEKEQILSEIVSTQSLSDCEAVDALWFALTNSVNLMLDAGKGDRERMISLVENFSEEEVKSLLKDKSVDSLIFLDPPLETVLGDPKEGMDEDSTIRIIGKIRSSRDSDPREALINLGEILRRIRNRHAQGIKTVSETQDKEILSSTRKILYLLCILTVSKLT